MVIHVDNYKWSFSQQLYIKITIFDNYVLEWWKIGQFFFPFFLNDGNKNNSWHTPKFFERLKCESEGENNGRNSKSTFLNSKHFKGKKGLLKFQNENLDEWQMG
jgi:hypothetical protein